MARTVPGSGAVIEPIFDEIFGVRAVNVKEGGSGYDPTDPPRLTVDGCGTPDVEALLYPIIDEDSGKIIHVRVLERGRGYDPLRLQITPQQETPNVIKSFDINRIWQTHPNSPTSGVFGISNGVKNDRLTIVSDNHPKPTWTLAEAAPGGGPLVDRTFNQTFVYRGGKDVPFVGDRVFQNDKVTGILSNGGLLHTSDWGGDGGVTVGFSIDTIKHPYVKNSDANDVITEGNIVYYGSSKTINEFALKNGVFEWGNQEQFTWNVKVELDNVMLNVSQLDETVGPVELGRTVDEIGGNANGEIAKIVRDNNGNVTRIYLRRVQSAFESGDQVIGSNGFNFVISGDPVVFTNGIFYIDFGPEASEFGDFAPGVYYMAPENVRVKKNYLIKWNQSDSTNVNHPMQFSTTADGTLNNGALYYNSTGASAAPASDYENIYNAIFIMNEDEVNRIYYYCQHHRYMSGYEGDEGYMILDTTPEEEERPENDYYVRDYYQSDANNAATIDRSRHVDGHSKVIGMSFDGYPIYGPWGYNSSGAVAREVSSYRLRTTLELPGARDDVSDESTTTYAVTISNGEFLFDGSRPSFLFLKRGNTYVFNQNDSSNDSEHLFFATQSDGWHVGAPPIIGDTTYLYSEDHFASYYINGSQVTYSQYLSQFTLAAQREMRILIPVDAPQDLYVFGYTTPGLGLRVVVEDYALGDLVEDYIYDSSVGTLDEHNGKFAVTPEYPNGTYAYFMTEDSSGNPAYPYAIGPTFYGSPIFEGDSVPAFAQVFPTEAKGDVVLTDSGEVSYIRMTQKGDNYFGSANVKILGGEGSGAVGSAVVQTITGLSLLEPGSGYQTPPNLIFQGGGGQGASGAANVDPTGKVTSISVSDPGEFYQEAPFVLISGGGGSGAKAIANINQGQLSGITITDPGQGYTSPPNIIFTKIVNLKRKTRSRQAFNSGIRYLTGITKNVAANDTDIFVSDTSAFPGSGEILLGTETIAYTTKVAGKFSGLTRGVNFNYDQRVILDNVQVDADGISTYNFNVGDRVIRRVENSNNKVAKVYDWNPSTKELLVTFEVDELAFIDAGIPSTEDSIVQFDAGLYNSSNATQLPHVILTEVGSEISLLTNPLSTLANSVFEDNDENEDPNNPGTFLGDGIADLVNTGTDYESQINLDGGIVLGEPGEGGRDSKYGIEETQGGQNTTLFQVGDNIKDGSIPFKYATIVTAGGLSEGIPHVGLLTIQLDPNNANGQNYGVNEVITGQTSGVQATVVSWDPVNSVLVVQDVTPYNTGDTNVGVNGFLYEFSDKGTIVDFFIQSAGTNYSAVPTVAIENTGDIEATATVNMTSAGDQVASLTITNGGYGIPQTIDSGYALHPTITFSNASGDTTGSGATAYAILGGEDILGTGGARYRIKSVDYQTIVRS